MKKIALFSLMCCLCGVYAVPAFATCGASTLGFDGNQDPDDDEFLYQNKQQFDLTQAGYENTNHQNSGAGIGIECDTTNSAGCDSGQVIELLPGHVFKGTVVKEKRKYQCTSSFFGDDMWEVVGGFCDTKWGNLNVGQAWKNKTTIDCSGLNKTENNVDAVKMWQVICLEGGLVVCKPTECQEGYKLDDKNGKCNKICKDCDKVEPQPQPQPQPQPKPKPKKTCEQQYPGASAARLACCRAGKATKWVGNNKSNDKTNCICLDANGNVDSTKEWQYNDGATTGQCVVKETPVPPVVEEGECDYYFTGSIEYANGNQYFEKKVVKLPKSKINKECGTDILKTDVDQVMELMKKLCETKDIYVVPPKTGPSSYEVEQAQKVLSSFTASAKDEASVWKTAEGKFNTTRLASDITAGVVLGTVGGVVTGNIIKKNQVKKGFEALHCTVGGQKVADWGDEFSVGLQR